MFYAVTELVHVYFTEFLCTVLHAFTEIGY